MKKILLLFLNLGLFNICVYSQYITHGPVIGAVTHHSARIYIRSQYENTIEVRYSADSLFTNYQNLYTQIQTNKDSSVIINLQSLNPNTFYWVKFYFNGIPDSKYARFKTFPLPGTDAHFTLTTGSCQFTTNMKVFDRMKEREPLMFFHTGDYTYPSFQLAPTYPTHYPTVELSWRRKYEEIQMKEMLQIVPMDYIHDDDDGFGSSSNYFETARFYYDQDSNIVNYLKVDTIPIIGKYNCMKAYTDFFPHYPLVDTSIGLYHKLTIGNTDIFFLDTRSAASPLSHAYHFDTVTKLWNFNPDTNFVLLGTQQKNWLKGELKNSSAKWKLIFCGVPFNRRLKLAIDVGMALQNTVFNIGSEIGTGFRLAVSFSYYWAAHPYEQNEILDFIAINNIKDVIFITGDTHHNVIDDGTNAGLPELNASGLSADDLSLAYHINIYSTQLGYPVLDSIWNKGGNGLGPNPNFKNAFGQIDVMGNDSLRLCVVDEDGVNIACHTITNSTLVNKNPIYSNPIKVYPNPTQQSFLFEFLPIKNYDNFHIYLVDLHGKFLKSVGIYQSNTLIKDKVDISHLANGTYFIIADDGHNKFYQKIIKQ